MAVLSVRGLARASHPLPALAVTAVMTAYAWSLGWRGGAVVLLAATILVGQLSVGWSNDAFDARVDAIAHRTEKPTVIGLVSARALWIGACVALTLSAALSWVVAGWIGGSFHVLALAMAWLYNTVLSRTIWSWVPYAVAFGSMPAFLSFGLDGEPPAAWAVAVFAIVGVSAHIGNALPDIASDSSAGMDGLAVRLGQRRAVIVCWLLLAVGSGVLVAVTVQGRAVLAAVVVVAFLAAMTVATLARRDSVVFKAVLAVVAVDVIALIVAGSMAG